MASKKGNKSGSLLKSILKWGFTIIFLIVIFITGLGIGIIYTYSKNLPDISALEHFKPGETTRIYSNNGELIAEVYDENRIWVPLTKMPDHLKKAFLAIEDDKFYTHHGISIKGIMRALWSNITGRGISQGGSTITQQLTRNLFLSQEQTYNRKINEILLSIQLERKFSKDQILEMYLNQIFLGSGAFGVEAASRTYFGKSVADLDIGEAALIAGLPQAPSLYSPFIDIKAAKKRQSIVLERMKDLGLISEKDMKKYIKAPIKVRKQQELGFKGFRFPYFSTYCLHEIVEKYGSEAVYRGGIKVYSTLDIPLQEYAADSVKWGMERGYNDYAEFDQAALVSIENKTGFIRAMVGGSGYNEQNQFNRAWQAKRQPGSSFKIFVYTAAINSGLTADTVFTDEPTIFTLPDGTTYNPQNSDGGFMGAITMRQALKYSRNVVAVKITEQIGIDTIIQYAKAMGIKEEIQPGLTIALGSNEVTILGMSSAASVLANMGVRMEPTTIKKILDSEGNVLEDNENRRGISIIPSTTAYTVTGMLQGVIDSGTGGNAYIGRPAAGKTGTTSDFRDAWFVGYTPEYSTAVWIGNDDFTPMNHVYGGDYPAMIWADFMKRATENLPVAEFKLPEGDYIELKVCPESGLLPGAKCPSTATKVFPKDFQPKTVCNLPHVAQTETEDPNGGTKVGTDEEKLKD